MSQRQEILTRESAIALLAAGHRDHNLPREWLRVPVVCDRRLSALHDNRLVTDWSNVEAFLGSLETSRNELEEKNFIIGHNEDLISSSRSRITLAFDLPMLERIAGMTLEEAKSPLCGEIPHPALDRVEYMGKFAALYQTSVN